MMFDPYELIENSKYYEFFTILDKPIPFNEFARDKYYDCVQLHSLDDAGTPGIILGFCGSFEWHNNKLHSLDGDSYEEDTLVYGYELFSNPARDVSHGINILVYEW